MSTDRTDGSEPMRRVGDPSVTGEIDASSVLLELFLILLDLVFGFVFG
jgi:hypothetical protein